MRRSDASNWIRGTVIAIGLLLCVRLAILVSNVVQSTRNDSFANPPRFHPFDNHVTLMSATSLLLVILSLALMIQFAGGGQRVILLGVGAAGVAYLATNFFGPTRWVWSVPGPNIDRLGDTAGYTSLLIAEVLIDVLLITAILGRKQRSSSARRRSTPTCRCPSSSRTTSRRRASRT